MQEIAQHTCYELAVEGQAYYCVLDGGQLLLLSTSTLPTQLTRTLSGLARYSQVGLRHACRLLVCLDGCCCCGVTTTTTLALPAPAQVCRTGSISAVVWDGGLQHAELHWTTAPALRR